MTLGPLSFLARQARLWMVALAVVLGALAVTAPAQAQSLDAAKSQGLVGERIDGLLGAPNGSPTGAVASMIQQINAQRMDKYRSIANSNGTSVQAVQSIAGRKLIDKAASGEYVDDGSGWRRK